MSKNKIKQQQGNITFNGGSNNSNKQTQVKSGNQINKNNKTKVTNNYFNSTEFYNDSIKKYDSVDRLGIYNRIGEIITCEVVVLNQTRIVKGKEYFVVANVIEDGKLIADHLHVDFGEYKPTSFRLQITGEVYPYGPDNDKRGVKLVEPPYKLQDTFKIFDIPYNYIDITEKDYEQINAYLNQLDNKSICHLIEKFRIILNKYSESRLGKDTIFNYALTQITLNANNQLIYSDKLYRFKKTILVFVVLLLASIIYDLTTLMNNPIYSHKVTDEYIFAEIDIIELFKSISIKCLCLQGLNGCRNLTEPNTVFTWFCKNLGLPSNKAYAHTVKHRYTNFEIIEEDEINIMDDKSFYAVLSKFMY